MKCPHGKRSCLDTSARGNDTVKIGCGTHSSDPEVVLSDVFCQEADYPSPVVQEPIIIEPEYEVVLLKILCFFIALAEILL